MDEYKAFLAEVRKSTELNMLVPDDEGLVAVRVDDRFTLCLQYIERTGEILCVVEVARLDADAPKEIYRQLLSAGMFGRDTAGGYFAIDPQTEMVVYNYYFGFAAVAGNVEGFVSALGNILSLCEIWAERIGG